VLEEYGTASVQLRLAGLPFTDAMLAHYRIDKDHTNPYRVWDEMDKPKEPSAEQFAKIRANQELALLEDPREVNARGGKLELDFELPMPGISLVLLSAKPASGPGKVTGLRAEKSPGLLAQDEILFAWRDVGSRKLRTYEVLCSDSPDGTFRRVNDPDILCTAFLHVRDKSGAKGYYKVRAVDYWGRLGESSDAIPCP